MPKGQSRGSAKALRNHLVQCSDRGRSTLYTMSKEDTDGHEVEELGVWAYRLPDPIIPPSYMEKTYLKILSFAPTDPYVWNVFPAFSD